MKNKIVNGVSILLIANLLGKFIGMIYRIPLGNILGAEGMGLYQMVFPVYSFALIIVTGGIPTILSKLVAESRAVKRYDKTYNYFNSAFIICLLLGFCFSLIFFIFGNNIAILQGNENAGEGYFAISIAIFFSSLCGCFKGYFQGYEDMKPTAISIIIEQVFKLLFGVVFSLSFISKGLNNAVFGAVLGMAVAEFFSFVFLSLYFISYKKKYLHFFHNEKRNYKEIVRLSFPFTLIALITPLTTLIESFFTVNILSNYLEKVEATSLYGIQTGMVNPIINFPIVLTSCLTIALLPKLSYDIKAKINPITAIKNSYKYVWIFVIACTFGYFAVGKVLLEVLFPEMMTKYSGLAKALFYISSMSIVFLSVAQISSTIMQANGKTYTPVINLTVSSIIRIIFSIILLYNQKYSILGLAFASTFSFAIYCILNLFSVKDHFNISLKFKNIILPILSGIIMYVVSSFIINTLSNFNIIIALLSSVFVGAVVFITFLFMFGVLNIQEIKEVIIKKKTKSI